MSMKIFTLSFILSIVTGFMSMAFSQFEIEFDTLRVNSIAGTESVGMTSTVGWSVYDDVDWVTATKVDGSTISVDYDANTSQDPRETIVYVGGTGNVTDTMVLIQDKALNIVLDTVWVGSLAGQVNLTTYSSVGWSVYETVSWFEAVKDAATNIIVDFESNSSTMPREAKIAVGGTGDVYDTVVVVQDPALDIIKEKADIGPEANERTFDVIVSVGWTPTDDVDWITTTKVDGNTFKIAYEANIANNPRTAYIYANGTGGLVDSLLITQDPFGIELDSVVVGSDTGTVELNMITTVGWSVYDDASWLTATKTGANTIEVSYDENVTGSPRMTKIYVEGTGGVSDTIKFIQKDIVISSLYNASEEGSAINIYPSPATELVNIEFDHAASNTLISVFNSTGKQLIREEITSLASGNVYQLNVSSLQAGTYIINVNNGEDMNVSKILVKTKD